MNDPVLIVLAVVSGMSLLMFCINGLPERMKRNIDRRMIRWWLRRTTRDRRPKAKRLRVVMDPSAGYRGGVPRIEEER